MTERYFVETPIDGVVARLVGGEAHHLAHVMRSKVGDAATLFDGSGAQFSARVRRVGRSEIELDVLERFEVDRELPVHLTLGVALPKGDRQRWLVEKATELGVARLTPLVTRHSEHVADASLARLRRAVIEASKQCGRNRLMEVAAPQDLADFLACEPAGALRLMAQPSGRPIAEALRAWRPGDRSAAAFAVGPEGGFTDSEVDAAIANGWQPADLGRRILRIETAALALVAVLVAAVQPNAQQ